MGLFTLLLTVFVAPTAASSLSRIPVAISGGAADVAAVTRGLDQSAPGRFALIDVEDRARAVAAIERREVYGAIVMDSSDTGEGEAHPDVLISWAASPLVGQALTSVATAIAGDPAIETRCRRAERG